MHCFFCSEELPDITAGELDSAQRVAFDPGLGRLWQVCTACARWNLTPLESRWEILEACERAAHDDGEVLLRSEHLVLFAAGALQLIRVGAPSRLDFADWRYSRRLDALPVRRGSLLRRMLSTLPELPVGGYTYHGVPRPAVPDAWLGAAFLEHASLLTGFFLSIPLGRECPSCGQPFFIHPAAFGEVQLVRSGREPAVLADCGLCGERAPIPWRQARAALRTGLAIVNREFRAPAQVQRAVTPIEKYGGALGVLHRLCLREVPLADLSRPARLALWICLDELAEAEALEAEWKQADELATIVDEELTEVPAFAAFRARVEADEKPGSP